MVVLVGGMLGGELGKGGTYAYAAYVEKDDFGLAGHGWDVRAEVYYRLLGIETGSVFYCLTSPILLCPSNRGGLSFGWQTSRGSQHSACVGESLGEGFGETTSLHFWHDGCSDCAQQSKPSHASLCRPWDVKNCCSYFSLSHLPYHTFDD